MLKHRRNRRVLALSLVALGATLMVLAPEIWVGVGMFAVAIVVEFIGIWLEHSK